MRPLVSPFGSFGRPIFALVCFAMFLEFLDDCGLNCSTGRNDWRNVQYGHMTLRMRRIVCFMNPSVDLVRFRMALEAEYLDYAVPYRAALKHLFDRNALQMLDFSAMQVVNHVPKLLNVRHAHASTRSPTLQKDCSTPAAIAGVQRSVLWRRTKL